MDSKLMELADTAASKALEAMSRLPTPEGVTPVDRALALSAAAVYVAVGCYCLAANHADDENLMKKMRKDVFESIVSSYLDHRRPVGLKNDIDRNEHPRLWQAIEDIINGKRRP